MGVQVPQGWPFFRTKGVLKLPQFIFSIKNSTYSANQIRSRHCLKFKVHNRLYLITRCFKAHRRHYSAIIEYGYLLSIPRQTQLNMYDGSIFMN